MKSESIQFVKHMFENPFGFLKLDTPQVYENMTVIPIIVQDNKFIDFISIKEAEELKLIEVIESDTVSQLEVINKSDRQLLIPFGMTVHGGKQDRTIWEPILLPSGGKQNIIHSNSEKFGQKYVIPAKCVEQSRWSYVKGKKFKSSNTRLHPNVAYEAISAIGQGGVWNEIQSHRAEMKYAASIAPTQSYLEMTKHTEKETEDIMKHFKIVDNQCGIAVFINDEFIGIEFYANPEAWRFMSNDILRAFSIEALRFKDKAVKNEKVEYHDEFLKALQKIELEYSERKGVGLGNVVEFKSTNNKWRGITLVHDNTMVQFYLVSKRGGYQQQGLPNIQFQTVINQRFEI
ncbi:MAG: ARPP-1 family domain-containing protein [Candidatus Heimdallarchaeota archaeon]